MAEIGDDNWFGCPTRNGDDGCCCCEDADHDEPDLIMSPAKPGSVAVIPGDGSAYLDEQAIQPGTVQEIKPPEVYRVEDGHPFEVSPWPSMEGKCHLCGHPETMHIQVTS